MPSLVNKLFLTLFGKQIGIVLHLARLNQDSEMLLFFTCSFILLYDFRFVMLRVIYGVFDRHSSENIPHAHENNTTLCC